MKLWISFLFSFTVLYAAAEHEIWWEKCLDKKVLAENFGKVWGGNPQQISRVLMRQHVKKMGYASILDVPCGLCMDYYGFIEDQISLEYLGVDLTSKLVELAVENGIPAVEGNIESLAFPDNQYDICYTRHILEHLPGYEKAVKELIRVAKKEVFIVFFIPPSPDISAANIKPGYFSDYLLYHNTYSLSDIERFLKKQPKVANFRWEPAGEDGVILHIFLK